MVALNIIENILRPSAGAYQPHFIGQNIPGAVPVLLQKQCQNATPLNLPFGETKCQIWRTSKRCFSTCFFATYYVLLRCESDHASLSGGCRNDPVNVLAKRIYLRYVGSFKLYRQYRAFTAQSFCFKYSPTVYATNSCIETLIVAKVRGFFSYFPSDRSTNVSSISHTPQKHRVNSDPDTESSQDDALYWNQVNFNYPHKHVTKFDPPHENQVNFDQTEKSSQFRYPSKSKSILMSRHKSQVNFDSDTKTKQFSTPTKEQVNCDHWTEIKSGSIPIKSQAQFEPITEIKSISTPTLISSLSRCPDAKTEFISFHTPETSNLRRPHKKRRNFIYLHWNQVNYRSPRWSQVNLDHPHHSRVNFMPTPKSSQVRSPALKTSQFRQPTQEQSQFNHSKTKSFPIPHTEINSISSTHTTKSISSVYWNQVKFCPDWIQVTFANLHKNQVKFDAHTKTSDFRPAHKTQVNFDPHAQYQIFFGPHTKTKSVLTPAQKPSQFRHPH